MGEGPAVNTYAPPYPTLTSTYSHQTPPSISPPAGLTQSQALAAVRPLQPALRRIDAAAAAAATHVDNIRKSMGSDTDQAIDDDNVRRSIGGDGHATGAGLQRDGAGAGAGAGANVGSKPKAGSSGVITSGSASVSGRMGEAGEGSVSVVESEGVGGVGARGAGAIGGGVAGEGSSDWIVDSESGEWGGGYL